jgi:CubicO group peptidase (beta-lactamase class C family)
VWQYASGTTNILAEALRGHVPAGLAYEDLPRRLLFEPLGMASAVAERDESGTFIASSYMFATARDWAVLGALFAADGVWQGRRLLPEGWVAYSRAPVAASNGRYGAHFWLYDGEERARARRVSARELPEDAFFAAGYAGQRITIVPSRGVVIVRLGYDVGRKPFDNAGFAARVLEALAPASRRRSRPGAGTRRPSAGR